MFLVSFSLWCLFDGSGNKSFAFLSEAKDYIEENKSSWKSYSLFKEGNRNHVGYDLVEINL